VLIGMVARLAYSAGLISQRVKDQSDEIARLRNRMDRFLDARGEPRI